MAQSNKSHTLFRRRRICCTGAGIHLSAANARFAKRLGKALGQEDGPVIVTAGYKHDVGKADECGTDWRVAQGVMDALRERDVEIGDRLETILPGSEYDRAENIRFREGKVTYLENRTAQARRFQMVNMCDVTTTVQGGKGTGEIIDLALAIERPVLPLPFTGGSSRDRWDKNRRIITEWFGIDDLMANEWETTLDEDGSIERIEILVDQVKSRLVDRLTRKCFIIMPYEEQNDRVYDHAIEAAVHDKGLEPIRLDKHDLTGDVLPMIHSGIDSCDCAICVITDFNPNVMFEFGLAKAKHKPVILLCAWMSDPDSLPELPFDIATEKVIGYTPSESGLMSLRKRIAAHLGELYPERREDGPIHTIQLDELLVMADRALRILGEKQQSDVAPVVRELLTIVYPDLQKAIIGNPLEHHPVVMGHMLEIAAAEQSPKLPLLRAVALALLHDISAVPKITSQMVAELHEKNPGKAEALDLTRQQNRLLHMREGSAMAHRRMLELNDRLGQVVFDADDIDAVCEAIRIHDNPSLGIPIPRSDWLATAFREADRLWMTTPEGICADLIRKQKDASDGWACLQQLKSNVQRFKDERELYRSIEPTEGPFCDDETFFRTKTGHSIFHRLVNDGFKRWDAASEIAVNEETS